MELNKCPNCSGKLVLANNRKRLVCSYCGSEFPLDEATRNEIGDQPVNMDWFIYDWDLKSLQENDSCKTMIQAFIRTLNDYETSSAIESYMREYLMGFDDVSANGIREENFSGRQKRWVEKHRASFDYGTDYVIYGDKVYIFHGNLLITVHKAPKKKFNEKKVYKDFWDEAA